MPRAGFLIFAVSIGALVFAFTIQYGFDIQPCVLCLWQRVPFGLAAALALTACLWRPYYSVHTRVLLALCTALFSVNVVLALFHTGVELHWWQGTSGCLITPMHADSIEDLRTRILNTVMGHCDQISWTFLGLSMANWNIGYSLVLAVFSLMSAFFRKPKFRS